MKFESHDLWFPSGSRRGTHKYATMNDQTRVALFEFLAVPAHAWLWCVGRLLGGTFECGSGEELDEERAD